MGRFEEIRARLAAANADPVSAPGPASKTYTARQAREDIAWLINVVLESEERLSGEMREVERLRKALEHYALMDWAPDSDERGEIAREVLGLADPHDQVG